MAITALLGYLTWPVLVAQLCVCLASVVIYRRHCMPNSNIPGPFIASFTRLWHAYHLLVGDFNIKLLELHAKHGSFVRIAPNEISVSHPDAIKEILLSPLEKSPWYRIAAIPDFRFQNPFSTVDYKQKNERAKHFASGFALTNLLRAEHAMDGVIESFMKWMDRFGTEKKPMHLNEFFKYLTYDFIGEMLFSKQFGFLQTGTDIDNSVAAASAMNVYAAIAGHFYWIHSILIANPLTMSLLPMGYIHNTTMKALDERRSNMDARYDMVAHWLRAHEKEPHSVTARDVYANTTVSVLGGSDTSSVALQTFVYHMMRHPAALQRARSEIDTAQSEGRCQDQVVSFSDSKQLPFLQACIKESLRIFSPLVANVPRVCGTQGVTIDGHVFAKGTILSVNAWVMHLSGEIWGPDVALFNPDRWLKANSAAREKFLIPFSAGYGSCPGQHLARVEISKVAATLVRDYDIVAVNGQNDWVWNGGIIANPRQWPVHVSRRVK